MAIGIIGGCGYIKSKNYSDTDVTLVYQTGGADNWQPYSTAGTNCYVYELRFTDIPDSGITLTSDITIIPRGTITQTMIEKFNQINAVEVLTNSSNQDVVRFYAFNGKPTADIDVTLRVIFE